MKFCSKCKNEKDYDDFYKNKRTKDGYEYSCKLCNIRKKRDGYDKEYYINNRDKKLKYQKEYQKINQDIISEYQKEYRVKNKDIIKDRSKDRVKKYSKEYYELNREKIIKYSKEYRLENLEYKKQYSKEYRIKNKLKRYDYHKLKMSTDTIYLLSKKIRDNILRCLKNNGYSKSSKTQDIIGCSFEEFKNYIESKFEDWMEWGNKGLYNGDFKYGWDIDHIIPLSSAATEEDIIRLNHYTNLQPLCSKINRDIKKDKIDYQYHQLASL